MTLLTTTDKDADKKQSRISNDFDILRYSALFSGVNLEVVKLFAYLATHRLFKPGDWLIEQDTKANQAFILLHGRVEITAKHQGQEIVLQELEQESFFGELALLAQFKWFFSARVLEDAEVLIIDHTAFQKVLGKYPEHKDKLIERIIQLRIDRLTQQTSNMLKLVVEKKNKPPIPIL
jgi:CRP-like cAMP-binding protein